MRKVLYFVIILCFLSGCSKPQEEINLNESYPAIIENELINPVEGDGYPISDIIIQEDFYKDYEETLLFENLQPDANNGIIIGTILDNLGNPYLIDLYLARTIDSGQKDYPYLLAYSPNESLKAIQAKDGKFLFNYVPAGIYGIIAWSPVGDLVIMDEENKELIFEVENGKITDLGTVTIY
jgi:hypothetical protein